MKKILLLIMATLCIAVSSNYCFAETAPENVSSEISEENEMVFEYTVSKDKPYQIPVSLNPFVDGFGKPVFLIKYKSTSDEHNFSIKVKDCESDYEQSYDNVAKSDELVQRVYYGWIETAPTEYTYGCILDKSKKYTFEITTDSETDVSGIVTICDYKNFITIVPNSTRIVINGIDDRLDVGTKLDKGSDSELMIPLRAIMENLGLEVSWNDSAKTVSMKREGLDANLIVGEDTVTVNGISKSISSPAVIENSRTLIPASALIEILNCDIIYAAYGYVYIAE